jgi:(S)-ureidoglycine aminohydrolase
MAQKGLVWSRAVVRRDYAILTPEGMADSVLPEWTGTIAKILAAPRLGARFAQYLLLLDAKGGSRQSLPDDVQTFFYVLEGKVELELNGARHPMGPGGYAYGKPGSRFELHAPAGSRLLWLKKVHQPFGHQRPADVAGDESRIPGEPFMGIEGLILKKLLPVDLAFDMAMNIFTFPPGFALPMIETHVMEHGLWMLQGQGVYYLGDSWREVQEGDFIWMGPYCPQSFYATGNTPSRYIYYKDIHRDVEL